MESVVFNLKVHFVIFQQLKLINLFPRALFPAFFPATPPHLQSQGKAPWRRGGKGINFAAKQYRKVLWEVRHDWPANKRFSSLPPRAPLGTFRERAARTEARRLYSQAKPDNVYGASQLSRKSKRKVKVKKLKVYSCLLGRKELLKFTLAGHRFLTQAKLFAAQARIGHLL